MWVYYRSYPEQQPWLQVCWRTIQLFCQPSADLSDNGLLVYCVLPFLPINEILKVHLLRLAVSTDCVRG